MKKIFTLLSVACLSSFAFGQTVFQSDLSSWASGDPTDFMNTPRTSIASSSVTEQMTGATYGTSMAELENTTSSHKRFTTDSVTVVAGESYLMEIWLICDTAGDIRTNYYDVTNSSYGTYNPYIDAFAQSGGNLVKISQTVTVPATCTKAEFIISLRNTDAQGIVVDSVAITATTPPVANIKKIYDIQYTTAPSGDSPEDGNIVTTKGIITGIVQFGSGRHSFFIQDSAKAWNGIFVYQTNDSTLAIGDSVEVTGTVDEYFNCTQLGFVSNINVLNTGNTLPTPVGNTTMNINNEEWEGVLVQVTNAQCTNTTGGFGIWDVDDGSGVAKIDDDIFPYANTAVVGTNYDVTGIGYYSFSEFKILPRDLNDISISTGISEATTNENVVYPNPARDVLNFNLNVSTATIRILDVTGKTVNVINTNANKTSVSLNTLSNGLYFYNIIDNKGNTIASDRFVVAK